MIASVSVRLGLVAAALIATAGLAGCTQSHAYTVLDRPPVARDEVPDSLPEYAFEEFDAESARWVAEHDGVSVFLGRSKDASICGLAFANENAWVIGCSGASELGFGGQSVGSYHVRPDGAEQPAGTVPISDNVYVRP